MAITAQEIIDGAIERLRDPDAWSASGPRHLLDEEHEQVCLLVAMDDMRKLDTKYLPASVDAMDEACHRVAAAARKLFPARHCEYLGGFNDNPLTTHEDIMLVLKTASEEGQDKGRR